MSFESVRLIKECGRWVVIEVGHGSAEVRGPFGNARVFVYRSDAVDVAEDWGEQFKHALPDPALEPLTAVLRVFGGNRRWVVMLKDDARATGLLPPEKNEWGEVCP